MEGLGLCTSLTACELWLHDLKSRDGKESTSTANALEHAVWVLMGAVSAARIASSCLMDGR